MLRLHLVSLCLDLIYDSREVWIAEPKAPSEKVASALGYTIPIDEHVELAFAAGGADGFDFEATLDEGRETRDLGLVVVSSGAVDDFDFHCLFLPL